MFALESSTPFQIVSLGSPTADVIATPVGITTAEAIIVTVPRPNVACTPVGKYLDSNVTSPTLNVEETPVGDTTAVPITLTSPTLNVAATPLGSTTAEPETVTIGVPAVLTSRMITGPISVVIGYLFALGL